MFGLFFAMLKKSEAFISLFFLPRINQKITIYIYIYIYIIYSYIYIYVYIYIVSICTHACMHTHIHALTIWVARGGSMVVLVES